MRMWTRLNGSDCRRERGGKEERRKKRELAVGSEQLLGPQCPKFQAELEVCTV